MGRSLPRRFLRGDSNTGGSVGSRSCRRWTASDPKRTQRSPRTSGCEHFGTAACGATRTAISGLISRHRRNRQPTNVLVARARSADLRMAPLAVAAWGAAWVGTWGRACWPSSGRDGGDGWPGDCGLAALSSPAGGRTGYCCDGWRRHGGFVSGPSWTCRDARDASGGGFGGSGDSGGSPSDHRNGDEARRCGHQGGNRTHPGPRRHLAGPGSGSAGRQQPAARAVVRRPGRQPARRRRPPGPTRSGVGHGSSYADAWLTGRRRASFSWAPACGTGSRRIAAGCRRPSPGAAGAGASHRSGPDTSGLDAELARRLSSNRPYSSEYRLMT